MDQITDVTADMRAAIAGAADGLARQNALEAKQKALIAACVQHGLRPSEPVVESLSALTALVSTRIYMLKLPQGALTSAVRIQLISEGTRYSHDGRDRVVGARVQVDAYAPETSGGDPYATVMQIAEAIHGNGLRASPTGLDGFQGDLGSPAFHIAAVLRMMRTTGYDPDHLRLVRCQMDYQVDYYA
jgi:hypothetical protein